MQMLYNSDSFAVVQFDVPGQPAAADAPARPGRSGYEIVDKLARREIFIEGGIAERFREGVQALAERESDAEAFDAYIAGYCELAQQPLLMH